MANESRVWSPLAIMDWLPWLLSIELSQGSDKPSMLADLVVIGGWRDAVEGICIVNDVVRVGERLVGLMGERIAMIASSLIHYIRHLARTAHEQTSTQTDICI